jgi:hypothetical protein
MLVMSAVDEELRSAAAPLGIVDFELARTLPRAQAILASWGPEARVAAAFGLGLDYLFLLAYASAIALACARLAARLRAPGPVRLGLALAWLQPAAAALDALENFGLARLLWGDAREGWAALAFACAVPKFAIVGAGLLYVVLAAAALAARWSWSPRGD